MIAINERKDILRLANKAGRKGAHIAPSLSMVEICRALFCKVMNKEEDLFVLSKGHGGLGYYVAMKHAGWITQEQLDSFEDNGGDFPGQPSRSKDNGVAYSGGSLGMGLPYGAGRALANKLQMKFGRVFVLLGDGECNEGSIWEAAMFAAQMKLNNLVAIIDNNGMQSDGFSKDIIDYNIVEVWKAYGWNVVACDGHDEDALVEAFSAQSDRPLAVVACTTKGKGISFMENNRSWHHAQLSDEDYQRALIELEAYDGIE